MDIKSLLKNSPLYPILIIEAILSTRWRNFFINLSGGLLLTLFALAIILSFPVVGLTVLAPKIWGLVAVSLAFYLLAKMFECYFNSSYYFDNVALNRYHSGDLFTFTVGRVLLAVKRGDILQGFLTSSTGRKIMKRCEIDDRTLTEFLAQRIPGQFLKLPINSETVLKLRDLVKFLFDNDCEFVGFLTRAGLTEDKLLGATAWVVREIETNEYRKRWWSEANLAHIPGLAKNWGFGVTSILDRYSWDLLFGLDFSTDLYQFSTRTEEVGRLETILAKQREANVFLVAGTNEERMDVVWHLVRRIKDGQTNPMLEHKRPVLFNSAVFLAHFKSKSELETELLKILKEVALAGNVILVLDNFTSLIRGFSAWQSNFLDLLYPFLSTSAVQVVALASNDDFHRDLETNGSLLALFDRVFIHPLPAESLLYNLEQTIWTIEQKYKLFFTYPAVLTLMAGAERYFSDSASGDKAMDLLTEIIPWAKQKNLSVIRQLEVEELLRTKTDVPIGQIQSMEKEKLLNLEANLSKRIIGQTEAIQQVSQALRRARAGTRNEKKPIGSFLFLGPTGVGKTETAKVLAEIMFGAEKMLLRLDMAEYQTAESAQNLIGATGNGQPGVLSVLAREHSYGVLLLDEFEKAHRDVHNLFLTIFDEGYFTDRSGRMVNLRNLLIIATSNAGADLIWKTLRAGQQINTDTLINYLITQAFFKPELLNRFDATVIFHPLSPDELKLVARLQLGRLAKRLLEKGLTLVITDYLADAVAKLGANESFGARPMQRFIQDKIEQPIADGLIKGDLQTGARIAFEPSESSSEPELVVKTK